MFSSSGFSRSVRVALLSALAFVFFAPSVPQAQAIIEGASGAARVTQLDTRFQPWVGCWRTALDYTRSIPERAPTNACIAPSREIPGSVDVIFFRNGEMISRNALPLPGESRVRTIDGCSGRETSRWIAGNTRLVTQAEFTCSGGVKRSETGLMSITADGNWLQVQQLVVGESEVATSAMYTFDSSEMLPAGVALGTVVSNSSLRLAAGSPASESQVVEIAGAVPSAVAEVWLAESGLSFKLNGKTLVAMADAGVPSRVIDMMVALSNPNTFSVRTGRASSGVASQSGSTIVSALPSYTEQVGRCASSTGSMYCSDRNGYPCSASRDFCNSQYAGAWGLGWGWGYYDYLNGYNRWGGVPGYYGYDIYGRPIGYGTGWSNGWYGGSPVIVVVKPSSNSTSVEGRYVKGKGYTRVGGTSDNAPASPRSSGSSAGTRTEGSGSTSGSSSETSTTGKVRTAKPRPPGDR